jgi:hypothetical protein
VLKAVEMAAILHTQEVTGSSPVAPTIKINNFWLTSYALRRRSENLSPVESVVYTPGRERMTEDLRPKTGFC